MGDVTMWRVSICLAHFVLRPMVANVFPAIYKRWKLASGGFYDMDVSRGHSL